MSYEEDNPFGSNYSNPFESSKANNGGGDFNDSFPGVEQESSFPGTDVENPSSGTSADPARAKELDRREAELNRREQHLAERVRKLDSKGRIKNWPFSFWSITYHSIKDEILDRYKGMMRQYYTMWMFMQLCVIWNWVAIVAMSGGKTKHNLSWPGTWDAVFASVYLIVVPFFSWRTWYRTWYSWCTRADGKFMWFTLWMWLHGAFVTCMLIGIPTGAGLLVMFDQYNGDEGLMGTFCLVSSCMWGVQLLATIYLYKRAHVAWKQSGVEDYLREQAKKAAVAEAKKEAGW